MRNTRTQFDLRPNIGNAAKLKSLLRYALLLPWCVFMLTMITIAALVRPNTDLYYKLARWWILGGLWIGGVRTVTYGAEKLDAGKHYVVMANHRSHYDCFAIPRAVFHIETRWVGKRELAKIPIFGTAIRVSGQILINRGNRAEAIEELRRSMGRRGCTVVFFPEGTRAPDTRLLPFKKGAAAFAIEAGLPIVPIAVSGTEKVLPRQSLTLVPATVHVMIGDPIDVSGMTPADRGPLTERAREEVERMLALMEPRPEADEAAASAYEREFAALGI